MEKAKIFLASSALILLSANSSVADIVDPKLVNFCRTKFDKYTNNSSSWDSGRTSSFDQNIGFTGKMPSSIGFGTSSGYNYSSSSNNISRNVDERDCDNIMSAYFQYLGTSAQSKADRDVGLAKASGERDVGLAQFDAIKEIGLTAAKSSERVGLMDAKSSMYTGLAGVAGNLLGSIFTSGNQKATAKAIAQAEIEKEKIRAATELRKAELEHEIRMASFGIQPSRKQQYFAEQVLASSFPSSPTVENSANLNEYKSDDYISRPTDTTPYPKSERINANNPASIQNIAPDEQIYDYKHSDANKSSVQYLKYRAFNSQTVPTPTTSHYQTNSTRIQQPLYPAKNSQRASAHLNSNTKIQQYMTNQSKTYNPRFDTPTKQQPANLHGLSSRIASAQSKQSTSSHLPNTNHAAIDAFAKKHSLIPSNNCINSIVIRADQSATSCFSPKPYLPAGFYTLNNGKFVKQ